jgi:molybdate transport system substrate-binding protein
MGRRRLEIDMRVALAFAIVLGSLLNCAIAAADELRILSVLALKQVLTELTADFESATGSKVLLDSGTVAQVQARVQSGEEVDLVFNNAPIIDELIASGRVSSDSRVDIARVAIGVAVRVGAQKLDLSSVDAFKNVLLAAKSISRGDPVNRGAAGLHVEAGIKRLGVASDVIAKSKFAAGTAIAEMVARGETELGLALTSEIVTVDGVQLAGVLPKELEFINVLSSGLPAKRTQQRKLATIMLELFRSDAAREKLNRLGLTPAN